MADPKEELKGDATPVGLPNSDGCDWPNRPDWFCDLKSTVLNYIFSIRYYYISVVVHLKASTVIAIRMLEVRVSDFESRIPGGNGEIFLLRAQV